MLKEKPQYFASEISEQKISPMSCTYRTRRRGSTSHATRYSMRRLTESSLMNQIISNPADSNHWFVHLQVDPRSERIVLVKERHRQRLGHLLCQPHWTPTPRLEPQQVWGICSTICWFVSYDSTHIQKHFVPYYFHILRQKLITLGVIFGSCAPKHFLWG